MLAREDTILKELRRTDGCPLNGNDFNTSPIDWKWRGHQSDLSSCNLYKKWDITEPSFTKIGKCYQARLCFFPSNVESLFLWISISPDYKISSPSRHTLSHHALSEVLLDVTHFLARAEIEVHVFGHLDIMHSHCVICFFLYDFFLLRLTTVFQI